MTVRNTKARRAVLGVIKYFLMSVLALILLFPFFVMLTRSFMTWQEATSYPVQILPESLNFGSYAEAMNAEFFVYFKIHKNLELFHYINRNKQFLRRCKDGYLREGGCYRSRAVRYFCG